MALRAPCKGIQIQDDRQTCSFPPARLVLQNGVFPVLVSRIFRLTTTIDIFEYHAMDPAMDICMVRYELVAFALHRVQMSDELLPQPPLQLPNSRTSTDKQHIRLLHPKYPRRISVVFRLLGNVGKAETECIRSILIGGAER